MLHYLEVFYRHRLLVLAPLVVALLAGIAFAVALPRTYESTAQLRFDPVMPVQTLPPTGSGSSAEQAQAELKELLKTRAFCAAVGRRGPLAAALLGGGGENGPITAVQSLLGGGSAALTNREVLDDLLFRTINQRTSVITTGPQVVAISFAYSDAHVAASTAQALVDQLSDELVGTGRLKAQQAVDFYAAQLQIAQTRPSGVDQDVARAYIRDLTQHLDAAKLALAALKQEGAAGFKVLDAPAIPYRAKGYVQSVVLASLGGLAASLLLGLASLLLLAAADRTVHRGHEMPQDLSQRVAGAIPRVR